jgi:Integrase core domain
MGSVGDAYDNALCESFLATLECELLDRRRFKTPAEARIAVFEFVEAFYNRRRRHSSIGYLSPIDSSAVTRAIPTHSSLPPCSRRSHERAGQDGRMAPPAAKQKNDAKQEGKKPVRPDTLIPSSQPPTKPGQVQFSPKSQKDVRLGLGRHQADRRPTERPRGWGSFRQRYGCVCFVGAQLLKEKATNPRPSMLVPRTSRLHVRRGYPFG